jgi:futalosine hydrolase
MSPPDPDCLILVATFAEAEPVLAAVTGGRESLAGRRPLVTGLIGDRVVRVLITGPGLVNTAQALTAAVERRMPGLIVQTGCGGWFDSSGLGLGDLALAFEEIDAHLGLEPATPGDPPDRLPWPVLRTAQGDLFRLYPLDAELVGDARDRLKAAFEPEGVAIAAGPFLTVATITTTNRTAALHEKRWRPVMENMEGAAAAHVAACYGIPFLEVRGAGNRVGRREPEAWDLPLAAARAAAAVANLIGGGFGETQPDGK